MTVSASGAREVVASIPDPEMPVLTLVDLGVVRDVTTSGEAVVVTITPTYSGCPAMATIRDDIVVRLHDAGFADVEIRTQLAPAWSTDWITPTGLRRLAEAGYSLPGPAPATRIGPVPLRLSAPRRALSCPQCGSPDTEIVSEFGSTPCKAIYRCAPCREPFEHVKEI